MRLTFERFSLQQAQSLGLCVDDLCILAYCLDFNASGRMSTVIVQDKAFFWVNYDSVAAELPILRWQSRDSVYRRFKKYCKLGLMDMVIEVKSQRPHFRFIPEKLFELLSYSSRDEYTSEVKHPKIAGEKQTKTPEESSCAEGSDVQPRGVGCTSEGGRMSDRPYYTTTDYSTKDQSNCIVSLALENVNFQYWWRKFCENIEDSVHARAAVLRHLSMFADKYRVSVGDIIYAVKVSVEKGHAGKTRYLGGVLKQIGQKKFKDVVPVRFRVEDMVTRYARDDCRFEYYTFDHTGKGITVSIPQEEMENLRVKIEAIEEDIKRSTGERYKIIIKESQMLRA